MKLLSSYLTPVIKTAYPLLFTFLCCVGICSSWTGGAIDGAVLPETPKLVLELLLLAALAVLLFGMAARLMTVAADEEKLYVSSCFKRVEVPLEMVTDITDTRFINPRTVTVRLGCDTPLGRKIIFVPRWNVGSFRHPRSAASALRVLVQLRKDELMGQGQ
ncbi:MAG: hypothetical protein JWN73_3601 [Betaproteobacteria bacterium]|nr:hypothetical protein [Betaproteobacteria bacterium]